jgi:hypothetical protein
VLDREGGEHEEIGGDVDEHVGRVGKASLELLGDPGVLGPTCSEPGCSRMVRSPG